MRSYFSGPERRRMKRAHADRLKRLRKVRPSRNAAGMTATLDRQREFRTFRGYSSDATPRLAVHGTLDPLATTTPAIGKARCQCCNGTGRAGYTMTDKGRRELSRLRKATRK